MPPQIHFTLQDIKNITDAFTWFYHESLYYQIAKMYLTPIVLLEKLKREHFFDVTVQNPGQTSKEQLKKNETFCAVSYVDRFILDHKKQGIPLPDILKKLKKDIREYKKITELDLACLDGLITVFNKEDTLLKNFKGVVQKGMTLSATKNRKTSFRTAIKNEAVLLDFCKKVYILDLLWHQKGKDATQQDFHTYQILFERHILLNEFKKDVIPAFIQLVETTRKFLYTALTTHHSLQIAFSLEEAKNTLKNDKSLIFKYAEQFGYIEDKEPFISFQKIRDKLAHPSTEQNIVSYLPDLEKIESTFLSFFKNLTNKPNLSVYRLNETDTPKKTPLAESIYPTNMRGKEAFEHLLHTDEIESIIAQYQGPLNTKQKEITGLKKLEFLKDKGLILATDFALLEQAILLRNAVAHASSDDTTYQNINALKIDTQNILQNIKNQHKKFGPRAAISRV